MHLKLWNNCEIQVVWKSKNFIHTIQRHWYKLIIKQTIPLEANANAQHICCTWKSLMCHNIWRIRSWLLFCNRTCSSYMPFTDINIIHFRILLDKYCLRWFLGWIKSKPNQNLSYPRNCGKGFIKWHQNDICYLIKLNLNVTVHFLIRPISVGI